MNEQETVELTYFQKIQVLTQQVKALKYEIGVLTSECDELRHKLDSKTAPWEKKYLKVKEENTALKRELKRGKENGWVVISSHSGILKKINTYESMIASLLNKQ